MKRKILIFGKGFIGSRLKEDLGCGISGAKIRKYEDAQREIDKYRPDIIINCIGSIGRNVDDCELDKDRSLEANTFVPIILAEAAIRNKIRFVHISSGCIYHYDYKKSKPVAEERAPDFFELFYSRTKIYSEQVLNALSARYPFLIIRLRVPLDNRKGPKNLLTKLLSFRNIIDLPNSVTYIPDFVKAVKHLIKIKARGIYNVANKGALRYPKLLDVYSKFVPGFKYRVVEFRQLNLVRTNLVLSVKKLEKSGFKVRRVQDVLDECVRGYLNDKE